VSRLAKFFAGNDPEKKQYGRIHDTTDIRPVPIFFGNILFYPVFASADSHRLIQNKNSIFKIHYVGLLKNHNNSVC